MALGLTARGSGVHNASATSFTLSPSGSFAIRSWGVLCVAADNSAQGGATNNFFGTIGDSLGNIWILRQSPVFDNGAANAGVQGAIYTCDQTVGLLTASTVITVQFSDATVAKTWTLTEVTAAVGDTIAYVTSGNKAAGGTGTALTTGTTSSVAVGNALVAAFFAEAGVTQTVTGDADTTNGSWSAVVSAKVGTTTSGSFIASQGKIQTTTPSTQTYDATLGISSDYHGSWIVLHANAATSAAAGNAAGAGLVRLPSWSPRVFPAPPAGTGAAYSTTIAAMTFSAWSATFSNAVANFTSASGGNASGTGAAGDPAAKDAIAAGNAAGVGAERQGTVSAVIWGSYSATFSNGVGIVTVPAGLASATGTANSAGTTKLAAAPLDTGIGVTFAGTTSVVTVDAGLASGAGTANTPAARTVTAGLASGTGAANNATISTSAVVNAQATLASGTGSSNASSASAAPAPAQATGMGILTTTAKTVAPIVGVTTATGTANQTRFSQASAGQPTGTGQVTNATVSTSSATNAGATLASGTGAANSPTTLSATTAAAGLAFGTGLAAAPPTKTISFGAGAGAGTGSAYPTAMQFVPLLAGTGSGAANDAAPISGSSVNVSAGLATGSGSASNATVPAVTNARPSNAAGVAFAFDQFKTIAVGPSSNLNGTGAAGIPQLSGQGPTGGQPPKAGATHSEPQAVASHSTPTR